MQRHSGAALLAAMLVVALVATIASAALWQQWRSVEIEAAERTRTQSAWVLTGALDWARLILREDARSGGADHLAEPWAVPLQEARLSTFLAADKSNNTDPVSDEAFLSGQIIDLQSLLNVNNLIEAGKVNQDALRSFARLFDLLGLPQAQLARLAENLRFANDIHVDNRSSGQAPVAPLRLEDLAWLGLTLQTIAVLEPYVTVLPERRPVNLNTASAEVIYAAVDGISLADAQRLVTERERSHFRTLQDARQQLRPDVVFNDATVSVASAYFEIRGRLRIGQSILEERSMVQRQGLDVKVVQRHRGVVDPTAVARAAVGGR